MAIELEKIKPWDGQSGTGADARGVIDRNFEKVETELENVDLRFEDVEDEIVQLAGDVAVTPAIINISSITNNHNIAPELARESTPVSKRRFGRVINYKSSGYWYFEQFVGTNITDWLLESNWRPYGYIENIEKNYVLSNFRKQGVILNYGNTLQKFIGIDSSEWGLDSKWVDFNTHYIINVSNLSSNYNIADLATAISLIPTNHKKHGLIITFKSAGIYYTFQYALGNNLTTDFTVLSNWVEFGGGGDYMTLENQSWDI